jgi:serine/threonine-protein kinase
LSGSTHDLGPGTALGRYEILAPIAAGGMARVWAARMKGSRGFAKTVAVKTLLPGVSDDVRYEHMFLDEAHLASQIRHANVVEINDLGEDNNLLYLVMEYVDGEPLTALRRAAGDAGVPLRLALKIVADTAAGLHAAHELSAPDGTLLHIVHRDVSPQNILISYNGVVKVTDFGIAKAVGRISQTTDTTLKGKPAFMAPEQIAQGDVDCRADIFALGIVMYQLVCGVHPFRGANDLATVSNIQSNRPIQRPKHFNPSLESELEDVVMCMLERDRTRRFQSARDVELALDTLLGNTRRPHDDELAQCMETLLGERGRERRRELEQAIVRADQRASDRTSLQLSQHPAPASGVSSPNSGRLSAAPADTGLASVASLRAADTARSRSRTWIGVVLALVSLVLGASIVGVVMRRTSPESVPSSRPELAGATPSQRVLTPDSIGNSSPPVPLPPAIPERVRGKPSTRVEAPLASAPVDAGPVAPAPSASVKKKGPLPLMEPGF